jgi:two-component system cell cycle response regulator
MSQREFVPPPLRVRAAGTASFGGRKRLLVVEDERIVALGLRSALEDLGYVVVGTVARSDEAIQRAHSERPDLVLMDIRISGAVDGIETASLLRARYQIPVIYMTGDAEAATLARALATEPVGYLVKPYNDQTLRTTIEVALRRHESEVGRRRTYELDRARLEQQASAAGALAERHRVEATIDPLTGLYNRRHLEIVMKRELSLGEREGRSVGIILLDMDRFKHLNDRFGHAVGDAALRAVSDFLRTRLRVYDTACRYGGEEIVIIAPGAAATDALALAESLRAGIENTVVMYRGAAVTGMTASFGVASFPGDGLDPEAVLRAADVALYAAKAQGRNRVATAPPALQAPAADTARL